MSRDRIDDLADAKRLRQEHRPEHVARVETDIVGLPVVDHGVGGVGMDGIEVDFATLQAAEQRLAGLHDELVGHLRVAADLAEPLGDGTSPVSRHMRRAFRTRADMEGGVQRALLDYLEELIAVRTAIVQTLQTYSAAEGDTVENLRRHTAELEEIA